MAKWDFRAAASPLRLGFELPGAASARPIRQFDEHGAAANEPLVWKIGPGAPSSDAT